MLAIVRSCIIQHESPARWRLVMGSEFQWVDVAVAGVLPLAAVAGVPAFPAEALLPTSGVVTSGEAV